MNEELDFRDPAYERAIARARQMDQARAAELSPQLSRGANTGPPVRFSSAANPLGSPFVRDEGQVALRAALKNMTPEELRRPGTCIVAICHGNWETREFYRRLLDVRPGKPFADFVVGSLDEIGFLRPVVDRLVRLVRPKS